MRVAGLADETWIGPYPGNPCHDVVVLACEYAGFQPRLEHSSDDFRAVVALAAAGAGVALVPRSALRDMDLSGVAVRAVDDVVATRRVFAAVRRGAEDHPCSARSSTPCATRRTARATPTAPRGPDVPQRRSVSASADRNRAQGNHEFGLLCRFLTKARRRSSAIT